MADKAAEAMAKAMGMNVIDDTETPEENITNPNEGSKESEETNDDEKATNEEATESEATEDKAESGTEDNEENESGDQTESSVSNPDQEADRLIVPKSGDSDKETSDPGKDFETQLAERSNGRFNSLADIEKALEEAPTNAFANEQVAKINEYVKEGGNLNDFIKTQTVDYSTMSPDGLVREHIMMTEGLTSEEADLMIESDFGVSSNATAREKQIAEIKLKRQANKALEFLSENQRKWSVPQGADNKANQEAINAKWESDVGSAAKTIQNIDIALNKTDKFSYKVEPDVLKKVQDTVKRPQDFFKRYIKADGTEDVAGFVRDLVKLEQFDTIVRSAAANNKAEGKAEVIKDIKNPDFEGKNKGGKEESPLSIAGQAAKAMFG